MSTLSYNVGKKETGKVKRGNMRKMMAHTFRKMQNEGNENPVEHGNEMIDISRTNLNYDFTLTGGNISDAIETTIAKRIKRTVRSDASLAREIIVQASTDVYEGLTDDEKVAKSIAFSNDAYGWFCEEFGKENVVGYSAHHDETNPHTHFVIVPIKEATRGKLKGQETLAQKNYFKGRDGLGRQHQDFRKYMNARGWDFDLDNKYENVDGVDLHQYKKTAQAVEAKRAEQKAMQAELREQPDLRAKVENEVSDELIRSPEIRKKAIEEVKKAPDVLQEASEWLKDDLFDSVLIGERRASERATKALEEEREALKAERELQKRDEARIATLQAENDSLRKRLDATNVKLQESEAKAVRNTLIVVKNMVKATKAKPIGGYQDVQGYTPELVTAYLKHNKEGVRQGKKNVSPAVYMDKAVKDVGEEPSSKKAVPRPKPPRYTPKRDEGFSR